MAPNGARQSIFDLLEQAPAAEWIDRLGLSWTRGSKRFECPSCRKPDALIGTREGLQWWWQCQHASCGQQGGVVQMARLALGLEGHELAIELERLAGIEAPPAVVKDTSVMPADYPDRVWKRALKHKDRAVAWLQRARGIETVVSDVGAVVELGDLCGLRGDLEGMLPAIAIPLYDPDGGGICNVHLRAVLDVKPRHMDIGWGEGVLVGAQGSPLLYGQVREGVRGLIVAEGAIDTVTLAGLVSFNPAWGVVGMHSAQAMAGLMPDLLRRVREAGVIERCIVWPHADLSRRAGDKMVGNAGQAAAAALAQSLGGWLRILPAAAWHGGNDANDCVRQIGWRGTRDLLARYMEGL